MTADELAAVVGSEAARELNSALERIKHCVDQLSDEQIWQRSAPEMNSIGNLLLHLCGNLRQWIMCGLGGKADDRNRPAEFAERGPLPKAELVRKLEQTVAEAQQVLVRMTAAEWVRPRQVQGFDVNGLGAMFDSVPHFRGHTQEIIHMTRLLLGERYRFAWTPSAAQGGM